MASSSEAIALYRSFLRVARQFPHYNLKHYISRRAGEGFRKHAGETDAATLDTVISKAKQDLELAKRQSLLYGLYERPHKSVMQSK